MTSIADLVPTTELEAVNAMLDSIGEAPIDSLIDIEAPDAGTALRRLHVVSRQVQQIGWDWNTEENVVITPNSDGHLVLPANTLKVIHISQKYGSKLVQRGNRLYDKMKQNDVFAESTKATLILALPFEELPEPARQYIMLSAAEVFQEGVLGSATLDKFAQDARLAARQSLEAAEAETGQYNVLGDNWSTAAIFYGRVGRPF